MATLLERLFPTPSFLQAPVVGVDFSDATMRFVRLAQHRTGLLPEKFGELSIPEGVMQGGKIIDEKRFTSFLTETRKSEGFSYVRVAIPESQVYSFTLAVDIAAAEDVHGAIELVIEDNIPLRAVETIFDYQILSSDERGIIVQVAAIAEATAQMFLTTFSDAGFLVVGFELDGQAIARAVVPRGDKKSYMIVDIGAHRTGITIVTNGIAVYTSTLEFGGRMLLQLLVNELHITFEEADRLKREYGLTATGEHKNIFSILAGGIGTVRDEINRRYVYWHEKKNNLGAFPNIETIFICGGHSNLRGLSDYLSVMLKLNVVQANPWTNCTSFDAAIPAMSYDASMSYVTTIGLSLVDFLYD